MAGGRRLSGITEVRIVGWRDSNSTVAAVGSACHRHRVSKLIAMAVSGHLPIIGPQGNPKVTMVRSAGKVAHALVQRFFVPVLASEGAGGPVSCPPGRRPQHFVLNRRLSGISMIRPLVVVGKGAAGR